MFFIAHCFHKDFNIYYIAYLITSAAFYTSYSLNQIVTNFLLYSICTYLRDQIHLPVGNHISIYHAIVATDPSLLDINHFLKADKIVFLLMDKP